MPRRPECHRPSRDDFHYANGASSSLHDEKMGNGQRAKGKAVTGTSLCSPSVGRFSFQPILFHPVPCSPGRSQAVSVALVTASRL